MNSVKEIVNKNLLYYFLDDMINIKNLIQIESKWMKSHTKYFYLLHWIRDHEQCKAFVPFYQYNNRYIEKRLIEMII